MLRFLSSLFSRNTSQEEVIPSSVENLVNGFDEVSLYAIISSDMLSVDRGLVRKLEKGVLASLLERKPLNAVEYALYQNSNDLLRSIVYVDHVYRSYKKELPLEYECVARLQFSKGKSVDDVLAHINPINISLARMRFYLELIEDSIDFYVTDEQDEEIAELIGENKIKDAVKLVNSLSKLGLAESSLYVKLVQGDYSKQNDKLWETLEVEKKLFLLPEIAMKISSLFGAENVLGVVLALRLYGADSRINLGIVKLSKGDPFTLLAMIESARQDWRDIIYWSGV